MVSNANANAVVGINGLGRVLATVIQKWVCRSGVAKPVDSTISNLVYHLLRNLYVFQSLGTVAMSLGFVFSPSLLLTW
jgi:hypothetical protein